MLLLVENTLPNKNTYCTGNHFGIICKQTLRSQKSHEGWILPLGSHMDKAKFSKNKNISLYLLIYINIFCFHLLDMKNYFKKRLKISL